MTPTVPKDGLKIAHPESYRGSEGFDTLIPPTPTFFHDPDMGAERWLDEGMRAARHRDWATAYWAWIKMSELTKSEALRFSYISNATYTLQKWRAGVPPCAPTPGIPSASHTGLSPSSVSQAGSDFASASG